MRTNTINKHVESALKEDAAVRDITTIYMVSKNNVSEAKIIVKEEAVLCGLAFARRVFYKLDQKFIFRTKFKDGDKIKRGTCVIFLKGKTRAMLAGERSALNFLSYLSGISTNTQKFIKEVSPRRTKILDTRKTTPGLRELEKYAVRCGGGTNHRFNLQDMIFIKDNHRVIRDSNGCLSKEVLRLKKKSSKPVEIEVDNFLQFKAVIEAHPHIILLDNMRISQLNKCVKYKDQLHLKNKVKLEASGGVTLKTVKAVAQTGVDLISIGALTQSHKAINYSLEVTGKCFID